MLGVGSLSEGLNDKDRMLTARRDLVNAQACRPIHCSSAWTSFQNSVTKTDVDALPAIKESFFRIQQAVFQGEWKAKPLKAINYASVLCVLDRTILSVVTIVLPAPPDQL
jgi:hypothetical protein